MGGYIYYISAKGESWKGIFARWKVVMVSIEAIGAKERWQSSSLLIGKG
jgi:hypothetical protein